ncbi:hypothetical protein ARTHROSP310_27120 [Arthrobacter sp. AD-310]
MGKPSRRQNRRNRHAPKSTSQLRPHGLTLTVGASPTTKSNSQPSLQNELRLVRSSLLYADHVDLVAPTVGWMQTFVPLLTTDVDDPWRSIAALPPETLERLGVTDITPAQFKAQMLKFARATDHDPKRLEAEQQFREMIIIGKQQATEVCRSPEALELEMVLESGAVTLISDGTRLEDSIDQQVEWFRSRLSQAMDAPGSSVLLDDVTSEFLRQSERYVDGLSPVAESRTSRAAVGAGLVERLPTFPEARMQDVLEAREELAEGRAAYRVSVKELAAKLQSSALEPTLPSEIDELWHDTVQPALKDLRKTVSTSRIAWKAGKRLVTDLGGLPSILVAVVGLGELAATLPSASSVTALAGRVAAAGAQEVFLARAEVRQHDLVYLLDVNRKLGNTPF